MSVCDTTLVATKPEGPVERKALELALISTRVVVQWHAGALGAEAAMSTIYRSFKGMLD